MTRWPIFLPLLILLGVSVVATATIQSGDVRAAVILATFGGALLAIGSGLGRRRWQAWALIAMALVLLYGAVHRAADIGFIATDGSRPAALPPEGPERQTF